MIEHRRRPQLYLASASPRRSELLSQIGVRFECHPVDIDESVVEGESAADYVMRLALAKAQCAAAEVPAGSVVLGSDTAVVCDGAIFGKPRDAGDAVAMLMALSGRSHQVLTAVAVGSGTGDDGCWRRELVTTEVTFRSIEHDECLRYWATGEPADKAGGYAIQGLGAVFVKGITGSYSAVVGLPLAETADLLRGFDIEYWIREFSSDA